MSLSKSHWAEKDVVGGTLVTGCDRPDCTQQLWATETIYCRNATTGGAEPHVIGGFLREHYTTKDTTDKPILMLTGWPMLPIGTKFYRSSSMRSGDEDDELGRVAFCYHGLILIDLSGTARDEVS